MLTGSSSLKIGYLGTYLLAPTDSSLGPSDLAYRFNNGVPNQLTEYILNFVTDPHMRNDALFAQEQWTRKRLTLQGALRFDHAWSYYGAVTEGPSEFIPVTLSVPETTGVNSYKDLSPQEQWP